MAKFRFNITFDKIAYFKIGRYKNEKINIKDLELNIDITQILNLYASKTPIIIDVDGNLQNEKM